MNFDRTGIIFYTINYDKCVEFYEKTLELKKIFESENLTCFQFGDSYLMIELDDEYKENQTGATRIKSCLRINVQNIKSETDKLMAKNVKVDYQEHSWGMIAKFHDPDGNLLAFKDSDTFEKQISNYKKS